MSVALLVLAVLALGAACSDASEWIDSCPASDALLVFTTPGGSGESSGLYAVVLDGGAPEAIRVSQPSESSTVGLAALAPGGSWAAYTEDGEVASARVRLVDLDDLESPVHYDVGGGSIEKLFFSPGGERLLWETRATAVFAVELGAAGPSDVYETTPGLPGAWLGKGWRFAAQLR
jgi:hypothetical protein